MSSSINFNTQKKQKTPINIYGAYALRQGYAEEKKNYKTFPEMVIYQ
jgi:hypothetical protein